MKYLKTYNESSYDEMLKKQEDALQKEMDDISTWVTYLFNVFKKIESEIASKKMIVPGEDIW